MTRSSNYRETSEINAGSAYSTGYALPGVLMITALTASVVALLFSLSLSVVQLAGDTAHYHRTSNRISGDAFPSYSAPSLCHPVYKESTREVCSTTPRAFKVLPPHPSLAPTRSFSLGRILSSATPCRGQRVVSGLVRTYLPSSPTTCIYQELITQGLTHRESIVARKVQSQATTDKSPPLIASFGDIMISDSLTLATDTVVFAVGSITIKNVSSAFSSATKVTLIAMQGDISIESKKDSVFPLIYGRSAIQTPSAPFRPPYPFLVELPYRRLLGISRVRAIKHNS